MCVCVCVCMCVYFTQFISIYLSILFISFFFLPFNLILFLPRSYPLSILTILFFTFSLLTQNVSHHHFYFFLFISLFSLLFLSSHFLPPSYFHWLTTFSLTSFSLMRFYCLIFFFRHILPVLGSLKMTRIKCQVLVSLPYGYMPLCSKFSYMNVWLAVAY